MKIFFIGLGNWIASNIPGLIVGGLLGAFLASLFDFYIKRPKLVIAGGGGGGGPKNIEGFTECHVTVKNEPGLFGIAFRETVIFGKKIHGNFDKGIIFERNPANECRAFLIDKKSGQIIAPLIWRQLGGSLSQSITLNSGEQASLMILARKNSELLKYFPYRISNLNTKEMMVPDDELKFDSDKEFIVQISYQYGRRKISFDVKVTKDFINGRLNFSSKQGGGGSF